MSSGKLNRRFVVLGAGVVGLSVARELALRGAAVTVAQRGEVAADDAGAATPASVGVLSVPVGGKSPLKKLQALARRLYPEFAATLAAETGIDVGFRVRGSLHLAKEPVPERKRIKLAESYRSTASSCRWVEAEELRALLPAPGFASALHIADEAIVDAPSLARALCASARRLGVEVRERCGDARLGDGRVQLGTGEVISDAGIVVAAGAWSGEVLSQSSFPVRPIRGQAIELRCDWPGAPNLRFRPEGREKDYHVITKDRETVWVGSTVEDVGFDASVTRDGLEELLSAAREVLPGVGERDVARAWAGLRPQALRRGGPLLGPLPGAKDVWVACGHYRSGILLGPLSARLLVDEIAGAEEPLWGEGCAREWMDAFRVDRG